MGQGLPRRGVVFKGPEWEPGTLSEPPELWARSRRRSLSRLSITRAREIRLLEEEGRSQTMRSLVISERPLR